MKQTAVEYLNEQIILNSKFKENSKGGITFSIGLSKIDELFIQSKEKEKQQQDKFAINFFNWCKSEVAKDLILDLIIVGEVSRNITTEQLLEIYKKEQGL
jgi:hypothetical protein